MLTSHGGLTSSSGHYPSAIWSSMLLHSARGRAAWFDVRHRRQLELQAGPTTEAELVRWETRVASGMCDPGQLATLRGHLLRGMRLSTQFSGMDCAREAFHRGILGMAACNGWNLQQAANAVVFTSSCDWAKLPARVCVSSARMDGSKRCHFGDFMSRLPDAMRSYLAAFQDNGEKKLTK